MLDGIGPRGCVAVGGAYILSDNLGPVIEGFLVDGEPGITASSDLEGMQNSSQQTMADPEVVPLRVWASSVGAASH